MLICRLNIFCRVVVNKWLNPLEGDHAVDLEQKVSDFFLLLMYDLFMCVLCLQILNVSQQDRENRNSEELQQHDVEFLGVVVAKDVSVTDGGCGGRHEVKGNKVDLGGSLKYAGLVGKRNTGRRLHDPFHLHWFFAPFIQAKLPCTEALHFEPAFLYLMVVEPKSDPDARQHVNHHY